MNKWILELMMLLVFSAALVACGGDVAPAAVEAAGGGSVSQSDALSPTAVIAAVAGNSAAITTDYGDALPVEMQLAFGTMRLENTNLAISAEQAQAILPYWRMLQSLTQNGNAADAEINAVVKQIQDGMNSEQIASIAAMALTEAKLQTMMEEGSINIGRGFGQNADGGGGGGFRPGGGPGGGLPGGRPGGGGPGGLGGNQADFASRQAEMEASGENPTTALMERASSNMVIRLLETKTGEAPAAGFGGFGAAFAVVSELSGLSEEELGLAMSEGQTLGEILEANGVSAAEAREVMIEALDDVKLADDQDLDSWIDEFLTGSFTGRQGRNTE